MSSINRDYRIFPLSCDPELEETEEREIYYKYLDSAFDEPRIHNIGIVGGFGVGKSSLLSVFVSCIIADIFYTAWETSEGNITGGQHICSL